MDKFPQIDTYNIFIFGSFLRTDYDPLRSDLDLAIYSRDTNLTFQICDFLDEYLPTVELLIKEVMKERESHELFQFILNGFNSDGTTGIITFNAESDTQAEYKVLEYGYFLDEIIAPSDDELSAIEGFPIEFPSDISTLPQTVVERFATIQKACNENDPETVSNKCVYSVIMRDPVTLEFKIYEDTITLT